MFSLKLPGQNGNAFMLLGLTMRALKNHGVPEEQRKRFLSEATASDYDSLLYTCMQWVDVR